LAALLLLVLFPLKYLYLWHPGPLLVLAAVQSTILTAVRMLRRGIVLGCLSLAGIVLGTENWSRRTLVAWTLPPEQRMSASADQVRASIPVESTVVSIDHWWELGSDRSVLDPMFASPDPRAIQFVVVTANGSGVAGMPNALPRYIDPDQYEVVLNHLPREPLTILGVRLTNSSYGHGPLVLRRRSE
jgi:hypothetical protein